uniref:RING-type domain-containing protein n=1 Tax=Caenorhabditis tropicalis TaxID=1561998 RepID=A0A1I7T2P6_9PELO
MKTNAVSVVLVTVLFPFLLGYGLLHFADSSRDCIEKRLTAVGLGISLSIVIFSCSIIKVEMFVKDMANNVSEKDRCRKDFRIGLTASQVCYSIPLLISFVLDLKSYTFYCILFASILSGATINFIFILENSVKCYFHDLQQWASYMFFYGTPQLAELISYHLITVDEVNFKEKICESIIRFILGLLMNSMITLNWTISKYDFVVLNDLIKEKKKAEEIELESSDESSDEENDEFSYKELKCRICLEKYSSERKKRTPRILKECGHTVCYSCAKQLWIQNKPYIECPFCKVTTFEYKGIKKLITNYAVIGLMDELKLAEQNKRDHCNCHKTVNI